MHAEDLSTFLSKAIGSLPDFNLAELTILGGRREQELSVVKCARSHESNYVAQNHVRYSEATQIIMNTFHIFPVILTRNIFDCLVSFRDHLHRESLESPMAYFPPQILAEPVEKQYDAIINLATPWFANFFASWSDYRGPALRVSFIDVAENPEAVISQIMAEIDQEFSESAIQHAIATARSLGSRINVGRSGRGKEQLSSKQIARVQELFSIYSHLDGINEILQ